jgi:REP element-mobilizing transposase RayT
MSHTYAHNPVHVVFSTKDRRKLIPKESQRPLWAYLAGVRKKRGIFVHEIGGMEDHLHMLIEIPLTTAFPMPCRRSKPAHLDGWGRTSPGNGDSASLA